MVTRREAAIAELLERVGRIEAETWYTAASVVEGFDMTPKLSKGERLIRDRIAHMLKGRALPPAPDP